jgi:hypothetical protein
MHRVAIAAVLGIVTALALAVPSGAAAATFTGSTITTPGSGAELFFDDTDGAGTVTVRGTVTGAGAGAVGDLVCYSPEAEPAELLADIDVSSGSFAVDAGTGAAYGEACQLLMVPDESGSFPGQGVVGEPTGLSSFSGPAVSINDLLPHASNGNLYGYYVESGTLQWSFGFQSLGECPVSASYATSVQTLEFAQLFDGNACLPARSGVAPDTSSRSALQVDGLNAYPPGAIAPPPKGSPGDAPYNDLTFVPGFEPLQYAPAFGPNHATVTVIETDIPTICSAPGTFPPSGADCPALNPSGIRVTQSSSLLPGGQVARVNQTFTNIDTRVHTIDLLFSQSIVAPGPGELPGFEFPGQTTVAAHVEPDAFTEFPSGPGTIVVIGDSDASPSASNPVGAITYSQPPLGADFITSSSTVDPISGLPMSTFVMHYTATLQPHRSVTYGWSFSQAITASNLSSLEPVERDRFLQPSVSITSPTRNEVLRHNTVQVRGLVSDPVGIKSVTVNGVPAPLASHGYSGVAQLKRGRNQIVAVVTNLGGATAQVSEAVKYTPRPCVVPALRGKTLGKARTALTKADCKAGKVIRVRSKHVRRGRVASSKPAAGARRAAFSKVRLYVSRG